MHDHTHDHHESITLQDRRRLMGITAIQLGMTVFSGIIGVKTSSPAFSSEMAHDLGDTVINGTRVGSTYGNNEHATWYKRFRRVSYGVVAAMGMYKAGVAFHDILHIEPVVGVSEDTAIELGGAAVIGAGNWLSYRQSLKLQANTLTNADSVKHNRLDRNIAFATAIAISASTVLPYVSEATGVALGVYTAWHMRPTADNLCHQH